MKYSQYLRNTKHNNIALILERLIDGFFDVTAYIGIIIFGILAVYLSLQLLQYSVYLIPVIAIIIILSYLAGVYNEYMFKHIKRKNEYKDLD